MQFDNTYNIEIIIGLITSLFGAYWWKYNNVKTKLQESHYRYRHTLLLQKSSFEAKYKSSLSSLIRWVENIYNHSTLLLNYSRHITLALIYSFMVFVLFWVLGASGSLGEVSLLGDTVTLQDKIAIFLFFAFYIVIIYLLLKNLPKWVQYLLKVLNFKLQKMTFLKFFSITFLTIITVVLIGLGFILSATLLIENLEQRIAIGEIMDVGVPVATLGIIIGVAVRATTENRFNKRTYYLQLIFGDCNKFCVNT